MDDLSGLVCGEAWAARCSQYERSAAHASLRTTPSGPLVGDRSRETRPAPEAVFDQQDPATGPGGAVRQVP
jgi:hypothetical protein